MSRAFQTDHGPQFDIPLSDVEYHHDLPYGRHVVVWLLFCVAVATSILGGVVMWGRTNPTARVARPTTPTPAPPVYSPSEQEADYLTWAAARQENLAWTAAYKRWARFELEHAPLRDDPAAEKEVRAVVNQLYTHQQNAAAEVAVAEKTFIGRYLMPPISWRHIFADRHPEAVRPDEEIERTVDDVAHRQVVATMKELRRLRGIEDASALQKQRTEYFRSQLPGWLTAIEQIAAITVTNRSEHTATVSQTVEK